MALPNTQAQISDRLLAGAPELPQVFVDESFSRTQFESVTPSGSLSAWTPGGVLQFNPPTYSSSSYDLSRSRIALNISPYVLRDDGVKVYPTVFSSMMAEQFFLSCLFSDVTISLGGKPIKTLLCPDQSAAFGRGIESLFSIDEGSQTLGSCWAGVSNCEPPPAAGVKLGPTIAEPGGPANGYTLLSCRNIYNDATYPYEASIDASDSIANQPEQDYIDVSTAGSTYTKGTLSVNQLYRAELLRSGGINAVKVVNGTFQPAYNIAVSGRIPSSLCKIAADIPGSIAMSISFRRAPTISAVRGNTLYDTQISTQAKPTQSLQYGIDINSFELLLKRNVLTPLAMSTVLHRSPSFSVPFLRFMVDVHPLTSGTFSYSTTSNGAVSGMLVAFVKNSRSFPAVNLQALQATPPDATADKKYISSIKSIFKTGGSDRLLVNSLRVSNGEVTVPETGDPWTNVDSRGSRAAYVAFKELLGSEQTVSYHQWLNNLQLFGVSFVPGSPDIRKYVPFARPSTLLSVQASVAINPSITPAPVLSDYSMVVISIMSDVLTVTDQSIVSTMLGM